MDELISLRSSHVPKETMLVVNRNNNIIDCTLSGNGASKKTRFDIGDNTGIILLRLMKTRGFVSNEELMDLIGSNDNKSVVDTISSIRSKFEIKKNDPNNFIEASKNKYRITCIVTPQII